MRLPLPTRILAEAERAVASDGVAALCQVVRTEGSTPGRPGWKLLVRADGSTLGNLGGGSFEALVAADARELLAAGAGGGEVKRYYLTETAVRGEATGMVCGGFAEVYLELLAAAPVLAICGGGPVGQAIARHAAACDFELLLVDDRSEFRRAELFTPDTRIAEVERDHGGDFLAPVAGRELYAVVVSRCWETDLAALASILRQRPRRLAYLGLMGSRRKVARIASELAAAGLNLAAVNYHAPIGLEIGAEDPDEIAISVLAEVIRERRCAAALAGERDVAETA